MWEERLCPACLQKYPYRITQSKHCLLCIATKRKLSDLISQEIKVNKCPECLAVLDEKGQRVQESSETHPIIETCFKKTPSLGLIADKNSAILEDGPDGDRAYLTCNILSSIPSSHRNESLNSIVISTHYKHVKHKLKSDESSFPTTEKSLIKIAVKYNSFVCLNCKTHSFDSKFKAVVRIKHENQHRKALLMLEQMIIKQGAGNKIAKAVRKDNKISCYFQQKRQAKEFISFIESCAMIQSKEHFEIVSETTKGQKNHKQVIYDVEILRPTKDDLIVIPKAMQSALKLNNSLLMCHKMFTEIKVIDVVTFQSTEIPVNVYLKFQKDIKVLSSMEQRAEFEIANLTRIEGSSFWQKSIMPGMSSRLWNASLKRCSDGELVECLTQMGHVLRRGDRVAGHDLKSISLQLSSFGVELNTGAQKVFLFRKLYPSNERIWRLKTLFVAENTDDFGFECFDDDSSKDSHEKHCFDDFCDELDNNKFIRCKVSLFRVSSSERRAFKTTIR